MILFPVVAAPFVGSFLATAALRMPRKLPVVAGRSRCPACGQVLSAFSLVPVASWLAQRARCRYCRGRISAYYPAVELAALGIAAWAAAVVPEWPMIVTCALGWALLTLAVIDVRERLLPDMLTVPLALAGIAAAWWIEPASAINHALTALAGLCAAWGIAIGYERLRGRTGLGLGDVKLIAAAGAWVGPAGLPGVILIAALGALAFVLGRGLKRRALALDAQVSFGPFLAGGLWLTWLYGPVILGGSTP